MCRLTRSNGLLAALVVAGVSFSAIASAQSGFAPGAYNPNPAKVEPLPDIVYQPWQKSELKLDLPRLFASERLEFQDRAVSGPQKIGIHRDIPLLLTGNLSSQLMWHPHDEGIVAYATILSPEAKSIRAQLDIVLPANSELVFYGLDEQDDRYAIDTLSASRKRLEEDKLWTPPADGERIGIEIRLSSKNDISKLEISLLKVAHRFRSTLPEDQPAFELACTTHSEAACGVDDDEIDADTVDSAVKLTWEDSQYSYVCSGVLVNVEDGADVYKPYILTAHHCISEEDEADSLVTHWFYETTSCDSTLTSSKFTRTLGGADVLQTREQEDMSLLELERDPPDGVHFAGWSTSSVTLGTDVNGAHHPDGEHKKYLTGDSRGSQNVEVCESEDNDDDCFTLVDAIRIVLDEGAAEGGSSGSALFEEVGDEEVVVGILSGTHEGCSNQTVFFGRFKNFYPHITTWFDPDIDDSDPDAPSDDHGDTTDTATALAIGVVTDGELEENGDVDVFEFVLPKRGALTVYTEGSTDTEGSVLDASNTVLESDDDSGEVWNFHLEVQLEAGTYYIEVSGFNDTTTGLYELHTSFVEGDDHGDVEESATEIFSSARSWNYDTPGRIEVSGDVDAFQIETEHRSRVTVSTEGSTDTIGSLKNVDGDVVGENDDRAVDNKNFHISEVLDAGIVYLFIEGRLEEPDEDEEEDDDAGKYTLNVVITTE